MVEDKSKKQKVAESDGDTDGEHANEELIASIGKLQEVQDELEKISGDFSDEVVKVEQEYNAIRKPVYEKRTDAIKSIPDFWLNALMGHPAISLLLNEEDQKVLKYLSSLEVDEATDVKSGYSIIFNFQPNPYFEETQLTKTFNFSDEEALTISATPITWKEGKGVTNGVAPEKKGGKRPHPDESSFFAWFSDTQPTDDLGMDGGPDEVAEIIREELWRNPLAYFIDEEVDEEENSDEEGGSDKEIDIGSSEDDGEEEDDDEE